MTVVGIDQSANHSGVTFLADDGKLLTQSLIEPAGLRDAPRLAYIRDAFNALLAVHSDIHVAVLEGYSYGSTSKKFILGEVGAVIKMCLYDRKIRTYAAAPLQLKKFATGRVKSDKEAIMHAVETKWGLTMTDDNLADSYVLSRIALQIHVPESKVRHELEVAHAIQKKSLSATLKPKKKRTKKNLLPDNI